MATIQKPNAQGDLKVQHFFHYFFLQTNSSIHFYGPIPVNQHMERHKTNAVQ